MFRVGIAALILASCSSEPPGRFHCFDTTSQDGGWCSLDREACEEVRKAKFEAGVEVPPSCVRRARAFCYTFDFDHDGATRQGMGCSPTIEDCRAERDDRPTACEERR
jgi:hypothetical protein